MITAPHPTQGALFCIHHCGIRVTSVEKNAVMVRLQTDKLEPLGFSSQHTHTAYGHVCKATIQWKEKQLD